MEGEYRATAKVLVNKELSKVQLDSAGNLKTVASASDANGAVVQPALSATFWQYAAVTGGIVSSVADVALKAAAGAGVRNFISSMTIAHDTLGAVTEYMVEDGAVVIYRGKLQTAATEGITIPFNPPLRGTANTAINFALITSVTGGVFVNAQGYTGS